MIWDAVMLADSSKTQTDGFRRLREQEFLALGTAFRLYALTEKRKPQHTRRLKYAPLKRTQDFLN